MVPFVCNGRIWNEIFAFWPLCRLLCVEHLEKKGKPLLYLVFEYMDTDLKKYIDINARAQGQGKPPLPPKHVQVYAVSLLLVFS
jgi:cyclin-dependent kinase